MNEKKKKRKRVEEIKKDTGERPRNRGKMEGEKTETQCKMEGRWRDGGGKKEEANRSERKKD